MQSSQTKRILGLDPGYGRLGFGVLERDRQGEFLFVTCGVITTAAGELMSERLFEIAKDLRQLIVAHKPALIVLEEIFFGKNTTTGLKVAEVRGVIQLLAAENHITCIEVKPVEVKLAITGDGRADKTQIQKMMLLLLKLQQIPSPDDAADALAIAWTGANKQRLLRLA